LELAFQPALPRPFANGRSIAEFALLVALHLAGKRAQAAATGSFAGIQARCGILTHHTHTGGNRSDLGNRADRASSSTEGIAGAATGAIGHAARHRCAHCPTNTTSDEATGCACGPLREIADGRHPTGHGDSGSATK
jgi:hypothetical protein